MLKHTSPSPETLKELSQLHNDLRRLRNLQRWRTEELSEPINKLVRERNLLIKKEFQEPIEKIKKRITEIRLKYLRSYWNEKHGYLFRFSDKDGNIK